MPSKRRPPRGAAQFNAQVVQSDYDTDTANLTDNGPAVPPPPLRSNDELNMMVLRRWCPGIEQIIAIAPFAVLYLYSTESEQWEKCETQGTLFVCQLAGDPYPRYRVLILNRKNLENFSLDLVSTENIQITEEFVIVQVLGENDTPHIYGIWIFSDGESVPDTREMIALTIQQCATHAEQYVQSAIETHEEFDSTSYDDSYALPAREEVAEIKPPYEPAAQSSSAAGQQIDLATLFRGAPVQMQHHAQQSDLGFDAAPHITAPGATATAPYNNGHSGFASHADTDFFRRQTGIQYQPVQRPHPQQQQQNALLDLFRAAK